MERRGPESGGRPGSMTMAMRAVGAEGLRPDVVRLGVVREDGRLEERVVPLEAAVTVGPGAGASLVVAGLTRSHVLVSRSGETVTLHVAEGMRARVATHAGSREVAGPEDVRLDGRGRGKVTIGATTLLFQLAPSAPKRARAALPTAVRPSLFAHLDWLFTAFVACSFLGHFGFVVYLESADWPLAAGLDVVPDHVAELIFVEPDPPPVEDPTDTADPEVADADDPSTDQQPTQVVETRPTRTDRRDPTSPAPMTREEASLAVTDAADTVSQLLIGANGAQGSLPDALAGGAPMESMEEVMGQVAGGVSLAEAQSRLRDRDGSTGVPPGPGLEGLRRIETSRGPVQEGRAPITEVGPTLRTTLPDDDEIEIDGVGEFDQRAVVRMIQTRRAQITACYEHAILSTPSLRGRIEIQMTIEVSGSVSRVRTIENGMGSPEVARCIENRVRGFRFTPGPTGGSVDFRFPFVFEQQQR